MSCPHGPRRRVRRAPDGPRPARGRWPSPPREEPRDRPTPRRAGRRAPSRCAGRWRRRRRGQAPAPTGQPTRPRARWARGTPPRRDILAAGRRKHRHARAHPVPDHRELVRVHADLARPEAHVRADVERGGQIGGQAEVRRQRSALRVGRRDHDAPRREVLEERAVVVHVGHPAVCKRNRGQAEALRWGVHHTRLTGERQVTALHPVWAAVGELGGLRLHRRRHATNGNRFACPSTLGNHVGIVGYVGQREALDIVVEALRRMDYRGYDSAGIAILDGAGGTAVERKAGEGWRIWRPNSPTR